MLAVKNIDVALGKKKLIEEVSFTLSAGKMLALVGPNGAGKSTLLKALSGDLSYNGEIYIHNTNIKHFKAEELAKIKAVMTQKSTVNFDFLVNEITMMGRYPYFKHVPSDIDQTIVKNCEETVGLSSYSNRVHSSLSGGEQQRNHFSRALAQLESSSPLPKLLLLDEPLNNLDVKYQFKIMELVKAFSNKGNAVIVVLHDLNIAAHFADELLLLKKGRVVDKGPLNSVFTSSTLTSCYEIDTHIQPHPITNQPMVFFNTHKNSNEKLTTDKQLRKLVV